MKIYRVMEQERLVWCLDDGTTVRRSRASALSEVLDTTLLGDVIDLDVVTLLAPVSPGKIVAIGRNYAEHARELGNDAPSEPLIFLKPPSAVIGPEAVIETPSSSERVDHEAELAIVIGRRARRIAAPDWRDFVLGYTCANDVTARDLQRRDVQFTRGKGFDTFAPLGPCIVTDLDVADLGIISRVNGEVRQSGRTSMMIFPPSVLLEFVTSVMTLEPGDVVLTGTPAGVGPLVPGDVVEVEIEGIGTLRNSVAAGA